MSTHFLWCFLVASVLVISQSFAADMQEIKMDHFERLINYPGKIGTRCPQQTAKTGVLLTIGQSNSANYGEKKYTTQYPTKVFNYFNGQCYVASSPLLGAQGLFGEFTTLLADQLIDNGDYDAVIIVSSGIGGTPIKRWKLGGDLNTMLQAVLSDVNSKFKITEIIWHQGEADFAEKTSPENYTNSFLSLLKSIRQVNTKLPPIYYAIATKCGDAPNWTTHNPIAKAQQKLANNKNHIYLGANTDNFLDEDRVADHCHLSATGQLKTANYFAAAIHRNKAAFE